VRGNNLLADKLDSFGDLPPNQIVMKEDVTTVPFVITDPLPVINVRVNDRDASFFIDTGAHEIYLDEEFARSAGVETLEGIGTGTFAGGKTAPIKQGKLNVLAIGGAQIRNVPVLIKFRNQPIVGITSRMTLSCSAG
jgi:hypothetical protein